MRQRIVYPPKKKKRVGPPISIPRSSSLTPLSRTDRPTQISTPSNFLLNAFKCLIQKSRAWDSARPLSFTPFHPPSSIPFPFPSATSILCAPLTPYRFTRHWVESSPPYPAFPHRDSKINFGERFRAPPPETLSYGIIPALRSAFVRANQCLLTREQIHVKRIRGQMVSATEKYKDLCRETALVKLATVSLSLH